MRFFALQAKELWFDNSASQASILSVDPRRWPISWILAFAHWFGTGSMPRYVHYGRLLSNAPDSNNFKLEPVLESLATEIHTRRGWITGGTFSTSASTSVDLDYKGWHHKQVNESVEKLEKGMKNPDQRFDLPREGRNKLGPPCDHCHKFRRVPDDITEELRKRGYHKPCTWCLAYASYFFIMMGKSQYLPPMVEGEFQYDP